MPYTSSIAKSERPIRIIDTLVAHEGAATMFVIGQAVVNKGTAQLEYALKNGFELGSHTYTHHDYYNWQDADHEATTTQEAYYVDEILATNRIVKEKLNYDLKYIRPSGLHSNKAIRLACEQAGMPIIIADKVGDPEDWRGSAITAEQIKANILNTVYDGKIILLHATQETTATMLPEVLDILYAQGYRFVTVSQLFEYKLGITDPTQIDVLASCYNRLAGKKAENNEGITLGICDVEDVVRK